MGHQIFRWQAVWQGWLCAWPPALLLAGTRPLPLSPPHLRQGGQGPKLWWLAEVCSGLLRFTERICHTTLNHSAWSWQSAPLFWNESSTCSHTLIQIAVPNLDLPTGFQLLTLFSHMLHFSPQLGQSKYHHCPESPPNSTAGIQLGTWEFCRECMFVED